MAVPIKNCLGWKGLSGTDTLAYYENSQITDRKSLITLGPAQLSRRAKHLPVNLFFRDGWRNGQLSKSQPLQKVKQCFLILLCLVYFFDYFLFGLLF